MYVFSLYAWLRRTPFEHALGNVLSFNVPLDVLAAQDALRIDPLDDAPKLVKLWVKRLDILGPQRMLLGPVRSAAVRRQEFREPLVKLAVGYGQSIRPATSTLPTPSSHLYVTTPIQHVSRP